MTVETKIRTLASVDTGLLALLQAPGGPFRWYDKQAGQGRISTGPIVRFLKVSGVPYYVMQGLNPMTQYRFQIDALDFDPEVAREVMAAVVVWLGTVSFAQNNDFASPPTTPPQFPNLVLNRRAGMAYDVGPNPAHVESIDVRIYNLEE